MTQTLAPVNPVIQQVEEAAKELLYINSVEDFIASPPDNVLAGLRRLWEIAEPFTGRIGGSPSLLKWPVIQRFFAHLYQKRIFKDACALCFLPESTVKGWMAAGQSQLELTLTDPQTYPLRPVSVFALGVDFWTARRHAEFEDHVFAEAKQDPRYLVWAITLLERTESERYGRKSVIKQETKQEIVVTFKEADGSRWVSGNASAVRQIESDDTNTIPVAFLPSKRETDAEAEL